MQFDHFNLNQEDGLLSIEDLKALRIRKQKMESEKKSRMYILEINKRYRKMIDRKRNSFFKNMHPFKKAA